MLACRQCDSAGTPIGFGNLEEDTPSALPAAQRRSVNSQGR